MIKNVLINSIADSREKKIPIRKKLKKMLTIWDEIIRKNME